MGYRADMDGPLPIHSTLPNLAEMPPAPPPSWPGQDPVTMETARQRLEHERLACEANLQKLNADLRAMAAEQERLRDVVAPDPHARLRLLADMSIELRTALHGILGNGQLLRIHGGLGAEHNGWLDAILAAGTQLLSTVQCMVGLTDINTEPAAWMINPPSAAPESAPNPAPPNAVARAAQPALRVLVADDVAMNRDIAEAFLRAAGHSVSVAATGAQAVSAAAATDFDVILMDVRMPNIDGLEATRRIRAMEGTRGQVPIIALTARAFADTADACRQAGMNAHLAKPFQFDTLNDAILAASAKTTLPAASVPALNSLQAARISQERAFPPPKPWIDVASPWNATAAGNAPSPAGPAGAYILDTQFKLKFTAVAINHGRQLVAGSLRTCAPPPDRQQYEFHWLLYTDPAPMEARLYTASCDLWRWNGAAWHSVSVPGAQFSADEMYDQGWRYCGPCVEKSALVEIV